MKRFLFVFLLFFLFGCVSSDPAQNLINQQQLIGTWSLHEIIINGKSINLENEKTDDYIHIEFADNNDFIISSDDEEFQKDIADGSFKYVVDGKRIRVLGFNKGESKGEFSFNFRVRHNLLILKNMKAKDSVFGRVNIKAAFPDLRSMSIVLRRV